MDFDNEKSFWGSFNPILDGLENWALWMGGGLIVPATSTTLNFTRKIKKKFFA